MKLSIIAISALAAPVLGFVTPSSQKPVIKAAMTSTGISEEEFVADDVIPNRGRKMSKAIPFLECPSILKDSELAGNAGFDPLGLSRNKEQLWEYREAEIKHARLAMLVSSRCCRRECVVELLPCLTG